MTEILFLFISTSGLYEYRRETCLKTDTDIVSFDDLKSINKISSVETDLIASFDLSIDLDFTRTNLSIS